MDLTILYQLYKDAYGTAPTVEYQQWFLEQTTDRQDLEWRHLQAASELRMKESLNEEA